MSTKKSVRNDKTMKARRGNSGKGNATVAGDQEDRLVDEILSSLDDDSSRCKTLAKELAAVLLPAISDVLKSQAVSKDDLEKCKSSVRLNKYENDRLEQYTRRENVRIFNLHIEPEGMLTDAVVTLFNDIMQQENAANPPHVFSDSDIGVCHRVGKQTSGGSADTRPIIVRFESRKSAKMVLKYKKNLKHMDKYKQGSKSVFIAEDLTALRLRLRDFLKEQSGVERVYTLDGNIHGTKNGKHFVVTSPDDLFDLDIEVDLAALKLDLYQ